MGVRPPVTSTPNRSAATSSRSLPGDPRTLASGVRLLPSGPGQVPPAKAVNASPPEGAPPPPTPWGGLHSWSWDSRPTWGGRTRLLAPHYAFG